MSGQTKQTVEQEYAAGRPKSKALALGGVA